MRRFQKERKNTNRGFTLAELLIAVAILAVLFALGTLSVVSIRRSSRQLELDKIAETIFVAAQEQLTETYAFRGSAYQALNGDSVGTEVSYIEIKDSENNPIKLNYVAKNAKTLSVGNEKTVLASYAVSEEIYSGSWVIEYSPESCMVYSVFYSPETDPSTYYTSELASVDGALRKGPVERIRAAGVPNKVGYYQGGVVALPKINYEKLQVRASLVNEEKLFAVVNGTIPAYATDAAGQKVDLTDELSQGFVLRLKVHGVSSNADVWLKLEMDNMASLGTLNAEGFYAFEKYLVLDALNDPFAKYFGDVSNFSRINEHESALNGSISGKFVYDTEKNTEPLTAFYPGENISVTCTLESKSTSGKLLPAEDKSGAADNSLFARRKGDETNEESENGVYEADIFYARHLQNLDDHYFKNYAANAAALTGQSAETPVPVVAVQKVTIDFAKTANDNSYPDNYTGGYANTSMYGTRPFVPIENAYLDSYTVQNGEESSTDGEFTPADTEIEEFTRRVMDKKLRKADSEEVPASQSEADLKAANIAYDKRILKIRNLTVAMDGEGAATQNDPTRTYLEERKNNGAGLFSKFSGSEIKDVYLIDAKITATGTQSAVGVLAGAVDTQKELSLSGIVVEDAEVTAPGSATTASSLLVGTLSTTRSLSATHIAVLTSELTATATTGIISGAVGTLSYAALPSEQPVFSYILIDKDELNGSATTSTAGTAAGGLVGVVNAGAGTPALSVDNVRVIGTSITGSTGTTSAGGLIGRTDANTTLSRCRVYMREEDYGALDTAGKEVLSSVQDKWLRGGANVGGLVGYASGELSIDGSLAATVVSANAKGSDSYAGGLVGVTAGKLTIQNSYADAYIRGNTVGGLAGACADTSELTSVYSAGFLNGAASAVAGFVPGEVYGLSNSYSAFFADDMGYDTEDTLPEGKTTPNTDTIRNVVTAVGDGGASKVYYAYHDSGAIFREASGEEAKSVVIKGIKLMTYEEMAKSLTPAMLHGDGSAAFAKDDAANPTAAYNLTELERQDYPYPVLTNFGEHLNDFYYGTTKYIARFYYGDVAHYKAEGDTYPNTGSTGSRKNNPDYTLEGDPATYKPAEGSPFTEDAYAYWRQETEEGGSFLLPAQNMTYLSRNTKTMYWVFDYTTYNEDIGEYETNRYVYLPNEADDPDDQDNNTRASEVERYHGDFYHENVTKDDGTIAYWSYETKGESDFQLTPDETAALNISTFKNPLNDVHQNVDFYAYFEDTGLKYVYLYYYIYKADNGFRDRRFQGIARVQKGADGDYITVSKHDNIGGYDFLGWYPDSGIDYAYKAIAGDAGYYTLLDATSDKEEKLNITNLEYIRDTGVAYAVYKELSPYTVTVEFALYNSANAFDRGFKLKQPITYTLTSNQASSEVIKATDLQISGYRLHKYDGDETKLKETNGAVFRAPFIEGSGASETYKETSVKIAPVTEQTDGGVVEDDTKMTISTAKEGTYLVLYKAEGSKPYQIKYYMYNTNADGSYNSTKNVVLQDLVARTGDGNLNEYVITQNDIDKVGTGTTKGYSYAGVYQPTLVEPATVESPHIAYILCERTLYPIYFNLDGGTYTSGTTSTGFMTEVPVAYGQTISDGLTAGGTNGQTALAALRCTADSASMVKRGYRFKGWHYYKYEDYKKEGCTSYAEAKEKCSEVSVSLSGTMPEYALIAVAEWENSPAGLRVEVYRQDKEDLVDATGDAIKYVLENVSIKPRTDTRVSNRINTIQSLTNEDDLRDQVMYVWEDNKNSEVYKLVNKNDNIVKNHFTLVKADKPEIDMDGNLVVRLYYTRHKITIRFCNIGAAGDLNYPENNTLLANGTPKYGGNATYIGLYESEFNNWNYDYTWYVVNNSNGNGTITSYRRPDDRTTTYLGTFYVDSESSYYSGYGKASDGEEIRLCTVNTSRTQTGYYIVHFKETNARTYLNASGNPTSISTNGTDYQNYFNAGTDGRTDIVSGGGSYSMKDGSTPNNKFVDKYDMWAYKSSLGRVDLSNNLFTSYVNGNLNLVSSLNNNASVSPSLFIFYTRKSFNIFFGNLLDADSYTRTYLYDEAIAQLPGTSDGVKKDDTGLFTFTGWYVGDTSNPNNRIADENGVIDTSKFYNGRMPAESLTVTAGWEAKKYNVRYHNNLPEGTPTTVEKTLSASATYALNDPVNGDIEIPDHPTGANIERDDAGDWIYTISDANGTRKFRFVDWYRGNVTDGELTTTLKFTDEDVISEDTDVYAVWEQISGKLEYTIWCRREAASLDDTSNTLVQYKPEEKFYVESGTPITIYAPLNPIFDANESTTYYPIEHLQTVKFYLNPEDATEESGNVDQENRRIYFNYSKAQQWSYKVDSYLVLSRTDDDGVTNEDKILVDSYVVTTSAESEQVLPSFINGYNLRGDENVKTITKTEATKDDATEADYTVTFEYEPDLKTFDLATQTYPGSESSETMPKITVPEILMQDMTTYIQTVDKPNNGIKVQRNTVDAATRSVNPLQVDTSVFENGGEVITLTVMNSAGAEVASRQITDTSEAAIAELVRSITAGRPGGRFRATLSADLSYTIDDEQKSVSLWASLSYVTFTLWNKSSD